MHFATEGRHLKFFCPSISIKVEPHSGFAKSHALGDHQSKSLHVVQTKFSKYKILSEKQSSWNIYFPKKKPSRIFSFVELNPIEIFNYMKRLCIHQKLQNLILILIWQLLNLHWTLPSNKFEKLRITIDAPFLWTKNFPPNFASPVSLKNFTQ